MIRLRSNVFAMTKEQIELYNIGLPLLGRLEQRVAEASEKPILDVYLLDAEQYLSINTLMESCSLGRITLMDVQAGWPPATIHFSIDRALATDASAHELWLDRLVSRLVNEVYPLRNQLHVED